jgi:hypothetical protein
VLFAVVLIAGTFAFLRGLGPDPAPAHRGGGRWLLLLLALAVVWVSLSGAGGIGFQNLPDWRDKNAILKDLTLRPWPVLYPTTQFDDAPASLVYYFALYLPPSLVGKVLGFGPAQIFLYLYVVVGSFLALTWFSALAGAGRVRAAVLFVFLSGLDSVGCLLGQEPLPRQLTSHIEWWSPFFQYSSNSTLLFWVPQHAMAGWLAAALVHHQGLEQKDLRNVAWICALTTLWSPYVAIGLASLAAGIALLGRGRGMLSAQNTWAAAAVLGLAVAFFQSGLEWQEGERVGLGGSSLGEYALFLLIEFGAIALALLPAARARFSREGRLYLLLLTALLALLPWFPFGHGNVVMRASIPVLFCFWVLVTRTLLDAGSATARGVLVAVLCVGAITPALEIARSIAHYRVHPERLEDVPGVTELERNVFTRLFLGPADSFFVRRLARSGYSGEDWRLRSTKPKSSPTWQVAMRSGVPAAAAVPRAAIPTGPRGTEESRARSSGGPPGVPGGGSR